MTDFSRKGGRAIVVAATTLALIPFVVASVAQYPALAQTLSGEQQAMAAGTYSVDKPHSSVAFTVTHLGITKVMGRFDDFDGAVKLDDKKAEDSSVQFTIKTASIDTNSVERDTHLKTDTFFDVAKYPEITFKSLRVNKRKKGYAATGMLTMHGVSHEIVLPFTVVGPIKGVEGGMHIGVETTIDLKRSEYGMNAYAGAVGDDIPVTIELDLLKDGSVPATPPTPPGK